MGETMLLLRRSMAVAEAGENIGDISDASPLSLISSSYSCHDITCACSLCADRSREWLCLKGVEGTTLNAETAEELCKSRTADRAEMAEDWLRRWCASDVTGWLWRGQLLREFCRASVDARPMGMLYVLSVPVLSLRVILGLGEAFCTGVVGMGEGRLI